MAWLLREPWPWWLSALALAGVCLVIWLVERRLFGISGSFTRLLQPEDAETRAASEQLRQNPEAMKQAMLEATIAEFGEEAVREMMAQSPPPEAAEKPAVAPPPPWRAHLAFLSMMVVGGVLSALLSNGLVPRLSMGETYSRLFGDGWHLFLILLAGGVLTGFGTRMAGGCTTGHGLLGCARLQVGSLAATAAFFGTAIAVSFLLLARVS